MSILPPHFSNNNGHNMGPNDEKQVAQQTADHVELSQGGAQNIQAQEVTVSQGGANHIEATDVFINQGGAGLIHAATASLQEGGAAVIMADQVELQNSAAGLLVADRVVAQESRIAVAIGHVEGDVQTLFDVKAGLAFGAAFGLVVALLRWLLGRK